MPSHRTSLPSDRCFLTDHGLSDQVSHRQVFQARFVRPGSQVCVLRTGVPRAGLSPGFSQTGLSRPGFSRAGPRGSLGSLACSCTESVGAAVAGLIDREAMARVSRAAKSARSRLVFGRAVPGRPAAARYALGRSAGWEVPGEADFVDLSRLQDDDARAPALLVRDIHALLVSHTAPLTRRRPGFARCQQEHPLAPTDPQRWHGMPPGSLREPLDEPVPIRRI